MVTMMTITLRMILIRRIFETWLYNESDNKDGNDKVEEMILWPVPGCKLCKGI